MWIRRFRIRENMSQASKYYVLKGGFEKQTELGETKSY